MTTNTDEKQTLPPQTKPSIVQKKSILRFIPSLLALGAILIAGYTLHMHCLLQQSARATTQQLTKKISTLHQKTNAMDAFSTELADLKTAQTTLEKTVNLQTQQIQTTLQQQHYQKNDWALLKARYLLEMAQQNATWSESPEATSALLKQADVLLSSLHDPQLLPIRQTLATEIEQMQAVPIPDFAGLLSQFDAIQQTVMQLPLKTTVLKPLAMTPEHTDAPVPSWRAHLQSSLKKLQSLIIIRHHNEPINPLQSPEHEALLRASLLFNLQEAQWAIMQQNDAVYQLALKQALANITRTYDSQSSLTQHVVQDLSTLQSTHFNHHTIIPSQTLTQLNTFIDAQDTTTSTGAPT